MSSENDEPFSQWRLDGPPETLPSSSLFPDLLQRLGLDRERTGTPPLPRLLIELQDPAWYVRAAAVRDLGKMGERAPLEALLAALADEHVSVRANAALALGSMGQRLPVERLSEALLYDSEWQVRESAALALAKTGPQTSEGPLLAALHDSDPQVRQATRQALERLHPERSGQDVSPGEKATVFSHESPARARPVLGSGWSTYERMKQKEKSMSENYLPTETAVSPRQKLRQNTAATRKRHPVWRVVGFGMAVVVVVVYLLVWGLVTHTLRPGTSGTQTGGSGPLITRSSSPTAQATITTGPDGKTLFVYPPTGSLTGESTSNAGWSPDGKYISVANPNVVLLNASNGQVAKDLPTDGVLDISWSSDGKRLVTSGQTAQIWNIQTGHLLVSYTPYPTLASVAEPHGNPLARLSGGNMIYSSVWSPDSKWIASSVYGVSYGYTLQIWNASTGVHIRTLQIEPGTTSSNFIGQEAWSPDGKYLAISSQAKGVIVWSTATWQRVYTMTGVSDVNWSPQGDLLASTTSTGLIKVWQAATGHVQFSFQGLANGQRVSALAWSPDGQYIAVSNQDVRIWSVAEQKLVAIYTGFGNHSSFSITSLAWSPDSKELAGVDGGVDNTGPNAGTPIDSLRVWIAI